MSKTAAHFILAKTDLTYLQLLGGQLTRSQQMLSNCHFQTQNFPLLTIRLCLVINISFLQHFCLSFLQNDQDCKLFNQTTMEMTHNRLAGFISDLMSTLSWSLTFVAWINQGLRTIFFHIQGNYCNFKNNNKRAETLIILLYLLFIHEAYRRNCAR